MKTTLSIDGMSCGSCVAHVERTLRSVPGVTSVTVDLGTGTAHVTHGDQVMPEALEHAVSSAGYIPRAV